MYGQLYIYDPVEALEKSLSRNPGARRDVMGSLQEELAASNHYAASYKHMYELLQDAESVSEQHGTALPQVTMRINSATAHDPRRYNQPAVQEVAAVFVGEDGGPPSHKDIVAYPMGFCEASRF